MLKSFPEIREHCGIFAIFGDSRAAELTYLGLHALQHRGQEAAGIVSFDGERANRHVGLGLVADVFADRGVLRTLRGHLAIGHNRYSTAGSSSLQNAQPLMIDTSDGFLGVAHNGNLINSASLRLRLQAEGVAFQSDTDSEVILHLAARSRQGDLISRIGEALTQVEGSYSLVFLARNQIIAVRDPYGFKPLCMGKKNDAIIFASETCALDQVEADFLREVDPGEALLVDASGVRAYRLLSAPKIARCIFELIYFARPDSYIFGQKVDSIRRQIGKALAQEKPAPGADTVIAVPDSSISAARGYAQRAGLPFELGIRRNEYIKRTFIQPSPASRNASTRLKFDAVSGVLQGRSVVVVDDSIVRGTTFHNLTRLLHKMGATQVHLRISSPPIRFPCFFGMDFPTRRELIAAFYDLEDIRKFLRVNSLEYISVEELLRTVPQGHSEYCAACFNGQYPLCIQPQPAQFPYQRAS